MDKNPALYYAFCNKTKLIYDKLLVREDINLNIFFNN